MEIIGIPTSLNKESPERLSFVGKGSAGALGQAVFAFLIAVGFSYAIGSRLPIYIIGAIALLLAAGAIFQWLLATHIEIYPQRLQYAIGDGFRFCKHRMDGSLSDFVGLNCFYSPDRQWKVGLIPRGSNRAYVLASFDEQEIEQAKNWMKGFSERLNIPLLNDPPQIEGLELDLYKNIPEDLSASLKSPPIGSQIEVRDFETNYALILPGKTTREMLVIGDDVLELVYETNLLGRKGIVRSRALPWKTISQVYIGLVVSMSKTQTMFGVKRFNPKWREVLDARWKRRNAEKKLAQGDAGLDNFPEDFHYFFNTPAMAFFRGFSKPGAFQHQPCKLPSFSSQLRSSGM